MSRGPVEFRDWPLSLSITYGPYRGIVRHIVDGDTIDVLIDFGFNVYHYAPVRLLGVDAPESNRPASRTAGLAATEWLRKALPVGSRVRLRTAPDPDSFGRFLAQVEREDGQDVSTLLLESGQAVPYP